MRILLLIAALFFALPLSAQRVTTEQTQQHTGLRKRLSVPVMRDSVTVVRGAVNISERGDASTIIDENLVSSPKVINGFRIVIFMDNSQTARRDALAAQKTFAELHTGERTFLSYENPYFKVSAGNFMTQEEAIVVLGRIQKVFPRAFITSARINIREFAK